MPFTLAHPAAVLPLTRMRVVRLSLPALFCGSVSPDVGYLFKRWGWDEASHHLVQGLPFNLVAGSLLFVLYSLLAHRIAALLPAQCRPAVQAAVAQSRRGYPVVLLSLLLGIVSHLVWDSFTHKEGWAVENMDWLQIQLLTVAGLRFRLCHLLWYLSSFGGVFYLYFSYSLWRERNLKRNAPIPARALVFDAFVVATLSLLIAGFHHLVRNAAGQTLVALASAALAAWCLLHRWPRHPAAPGVPRAEEITR
jgi:hypothetical protein